MRTRPAALPLTVRLPRPCACRKDKRDGKGDRFDENELREQWHTSETPNWDYTANNERNEKISFTHGDKWGLNHTNAGGDRGAF